MVMGSCSVETVSGVFFLQEKSGKTEKSNAKKQQRDFAAKEFGKDFEPKRAMLKISFCAVETAYCPNIAVGSDAEAYSLYEQNVDIARGNMSILSEFIGYVIFVYFFVDIRAKTHVRDKKCRLDTKR